MRLEQTQKRLRWKRSNSHWQPRALSRTEGLVEICITKSWNHGIAEGLNSHYPKWIRLIKQQKRWASPNHRLIEPWLDRQILLGAFLRWKCLGRYVDRSSLLGMPGERGGRRWVWWEDYGARLWPQIDKRMSKSIYNNCNIDNPLYFVSKRKTRLRSI